MAVTIGSIASIIRTNLGYYRRELLKLIPGEFQRVIIDRGNATMVSKQIDVLRLEEEDRLRVLISGGVELNDEELGKIINSEEVLPNEFWEEKRRQIRFLGSVGLLILMVLG